MGEMFPLACVVIGGILGFVIGGAAASNYYSDYWEGYFRLFPENEPKGSHTDD